LAPNQAPNLTLTEIEIQSQKLAPHHTKRLLDIYTRTTLSLACLLGILAWHPCLAPYLTLSQTLACLLSTAQHQTQHQAPNLCLLNFTPNLTPLLSTIQDTKPKHLTLA
jgi:hypothetical protein